MSKIVESPNIRIGARSKATLRDLAAREGKPMQTVLEEAIEQYRRDKFFRDLDQDFARLQANAPAWAEEAAERRLWESADTDGIERE